MAFSDKDIGLRQAAETSRQARRPRICMPSARNVTRRVFQCGHYEGEDVLREIDDVDLICLEPGWGFQFKESWHRRLLSRDVSRRLIFLNPGLHKVRLTREYDLFVAVCQNWWDFLYLSAIDGWKDHCKTSVCWIVEMMAAMIPLYTHWLHALRRFDHVFVGCKDTVGPLSNAVNRSCRWLEFAVDTLRFTAYPNPSARVVDVYSVGRRWEGIHRALLQAAGRREIFYLYDTVQSVAERHVFDHQQHRDLLANLAKRSRYFLVAPGKVNVPAETQGQVEIGSRYYEGAAAGAVMIGQSPDCEAFRKMFDWPDAVININPDGSDVTKVLAELDAQPDRLREIHRRNSREALLRHDWVYRWKEVLEIAGLGPTPALKDRENRLKELAALTRNDG